MGHSFNEEVVELGKVPFSEINISTRVNKNSNTNQHCLKGERGRKTNMVLWGRLVSLTRAL